MNRISHRFARVLAICVVILPGCLSLSAQTVAISGKIANVSSSGVGSNAYLQAELTGCGNNRAQYSGGVITAPFQYFTDSTGAFSGTIVKNTAITCGNNVGSVSNPVGNYWMQPFIDGVPTGPRLCFVVTATFDWNTASACTNSPTPIPAPTDNIYARLDATNMPFTGAISGTALSNLLAARVTSIGSGLQIPSTLTLNLDAYSGGVNDILTTKTQWQALRFNVTGRTIGERKGVQGFANCYAKGDCIAMYGLAFDSGGYLTGGDEGTHGLDGWAIQGSEDAYTTDGGFPRGTVSGVSGDTITVTWTSSTNQHLGDHRPLVNTSRGVVSAGTVSGITGSPCIATGAGTAWASLGSGAHSGDVFLNVTGNDYGTVKHIVPISSINADNVHATLDYQLAELGATCFGVGMTTSGTYNIYKGGTIASLVDAGSGNDPVSVVLASGQGANFQVGDTVQVPLGYNYHGGGIQAVVSRLIGETQGQGFYAHNVSPNNQPFRDGFRASGAYLNGISFDSGTISGHGVVFSNPVTGALLRQGDSSASSQKIFSVLNGSLSERYLLYDRTNDQWQWSGNQIFSGTDARIGIGTSPQPSILAYYFWSNANWKGQIIAPNTAAASNAVPYFGIQLSGTPLFQVEKDRTVISNGMNFKIFSNNEVTQVFSVDGATGNTSTAGTITSTIATGTAPLTVASTTNVANLNASSLNGATFASPGPIGSGTPSTGAFAGLTVGTGVTADGSGLKHARVTTGSISASGVASVTVTWGTAFADTNYTVNCSVIEAGVAANNVVGLNMYRINSKLAASVAVTIQNLDGVSARTGEVDCTAIHDYP